jgi:hypothetical protein
VHLHGITLQDFVAALQITYLAPVNNNIGHTHYLKTTVAQKVKKVPSLGEPEVSLPCTQQVTIGLCYKQSQ